MAAGKIRRSPLERAEYAIILSTLLLLVVVMVQPLLNLLAVSLSSPSEVARMSGLTIIPEGFSLEV
ncbi:carbohydrate ABC transporter permease, partial [Ochrobactrum sp. GRS2]|nr:carbohydrate ABC transporter permease [Ochrobactrum sp. GRS2]